MHSPGQGLLGRPPSSPLVTAPQRSRGSAGLTTGDSVPLGHPSPALARLLSNPSPSSASKSGDLALPGPGAAAGQFPALPVSRAGTGCDIKCIFLLVSTKQRKGGRLLPASPPKRTQLCRSFQADLSELQKGPETPIFCQARGGECLVPWKQRPEGDALRVPVRPWREDDGLAWGRPPSPGRRQGAGHASRAQL